MPEVKAFQTSPDNLKIRPKPSPSSTKYLAPTFPCKLTFNRQLASRVSAIIPKLSNLLQDPLVTLTSTGGKEKVFQKNTHDLIHCYRIILKLFTAFTYAIPEYENDLRGQTKPSFS